VSFLVALTVAQPLPALTGAVNDLAGVLSPGEAAEIERRIRALQAATGDVVVVATVDTYEPYGSIEEYAVRLFEQAGVGRRADDNGLLIVAAVQSRAVRIEVGYGLEEFVTDGYAGETIRQAMLPAFRQGQYGQGLLEGTTRIVRRIADARGVALQDVPEPPPPAPVEGVEIPLWVFILVALILLSLRSRRRRRRFFGRPRHTNTWSGWSGGVGPFGGLGGFGGFGAGGFGGGRGGSGGGFGGFGGGRSGGGGASGGW
jgi:uncharacterized protein